MPGQNKYLAERIKNQMEASNYEITFEEAKEKAKETGREEGGRTPDEKPNRREH